MDRGAVLYCGLFIIISVLCFKVIGMINDKFFQFNGVLLYIFLLFVVPGVVLFALFTASKIRNYFL